MLLNKKNMLAAISSVLIAFTLLLGMNISSGLILGDYLFKRVGLPVFTGGDSGLYIPGLFAISSFILGVFLFRQYFRKYRTRQGELILIVLLVFAVFYQPVYNVSYAFIKSQNNGLKAIEYNKADSICKYNISSDNAFVECRCSLKLVNYSHRTQNFKIELNQPEEQIKESLRKIFGKDVNLDCDNEIHTVSLPPAQSSIFSRPAAVTIDMEFRLKKKENNLDLNCCGSISGPSITISNENETRKISS